MLSQVFSVYMAHCTVTLEGYYTYTPLHKQEKGVKKNLTMQGIWEVLAGLPAVEVADFTARAWCHICYVNRHSRG